jgi:hypothetical protein
MQPTRNGFLTLVAVQAAVLLGSGCASAPPRAEWGLNQGQCSDQHAVGLDCSRGQGSVVAQGEPAPAQGPEALRAGAETNLGGARESKREAPPSERRPQRSSPPSRPPRH